MQTGIGLQGGLRKKRDPVLFYHSRRRRRDGNVCDYCVSAGFSCRDMVASQAGQQLRLLLISCLFCYYCSSCSIPCQNGIIQVRFDSAYPGVHFITLAASWPASCLWPQTGLVQPHPRTTDQVTPRTMLLLFSSFHSGHAIIIRSGRAL